MENDLEIEEVEFESTETDESEEIEIVEEVEEDDEIFNFAVVENKPVFPGCEKRPEATDHTGQRSRSRPTPVYSNMVPAREQTLVLSGVMEKAYQVVAPLLVLWGF